MTAKEIKGIGEIFEEVKARRDKEQRYRCAKELVYCETIQQEVQKENDIMMSKARETAFQEVLNIIMEKK